MKKMLYCAAALSAVLFAGSCQRENLESVVNGGVTYTITLPETVQTKGSNGYAEYDLYYEVYKTADLNELETAEALFDNFGEPIVMNSTETTVPFDLLNDQDYTILFWANKKDADCFVLDDLRKVGIKSSASNNNDRDAFCKMDQLFNVNGALAKKVTLTRPFAQLNIATEIPTVEYDIIPDYSYVKVTKVPTVYNVATGTATGEDVVEFTTAAVPTDKQINVGTKPYHLVAMNYVLVPEGNISVYYAIETGSGIVSNTINNVPVKVNYRTNIVGNLLTSNATYTVELKPGFDSPDEVVEVVTVSTATELVEAIEGASTTEGEETNIKLEGDINLSDLFASLTRATTEDPKSITINKGLSATIDLNGYSLTGVDEGTASFGLITNRGNLTITNSSSKQSRIALVAKENREWNAYSSVISNTVGGNLLVKGNVLIEHLGGTDMAYGIDNLTNGKGTSAIVTVDGATVKSTYRAIRQFLNGTEANNSLTVKSGSVIESTNGNKSIWMQDPSANANSGSLVVEAGAQLKTDAYLDVDERSTEWPIEVSIAASALVNGAKVVSELPVGYSIAETDGVWTVSRDWSVNPEQTEYTIYTATGLKWVSDQVNTMEYYVSAAANIFDGKTVYLANDIDLRGEEWRPIGDYAFSRTSFNGIFDGQNHTVSNFKVTEPVRWTEKVTEASYGFFGNVKGTVKNVNIENAVVNPDGGRYSAALVGRLHNGGKIENCHVKSSSVTINHWQVGGIVGQNNNGNIRNCSISGSTITGMAAVGAIVGMDMKAGEHSIENCRVENTELVQNESFGESYDSTYGLAVGLVNASGIILYLNNVVVENNTIMGVSSDILVGENEAGSKIIVDGYEILAPGLGYNSTSKTYAVSSAEGLVAMSNTTIKARESVVLTADIDLAGVEFTGLSAFNPEPNNTFDGQGHTVSNWTYTGGSADMAFIKSWVGTIKNVTIQRASLKTAGRSAVLAANTYANIEDCHIVNSRIEDSYWACGVIAGLYNSGSIKDCSVDGCYVKSNGGVGGIVGVINESAGERMIDGCTVKNTTVNNTGAYGEAYSGALMAGMFNAGDATYKFINCTLENNTKEGQYVGDLFYSAEGETVYVDGVQQ